MAEANLGLPHPQASNAVEISSDIINRTVAQLTTTAPDADR